MSNLPASVLELIDQIGSAAALRLVQTRGGTLLRVPVAWREHSPARDALVELIGEPAAAALIAAYPGQRLAIPRCAQALRDERDARIIAAYSAGVAVSTLARQHQLTERQIRHLLKRCPPATGIDLAPQLCLPL